MSFSDNFKSKVSNQMMILLNNLSAGKMQKTKTIDQHIKPRTFKLSGTKGKKETNKKKRKGKETNKNKNKGEETKRTKKLGSILRRNNAAKNCKFKDFFIVYYFSYDCTIIFCQKFSLFVS